jgi:hypothetical protein
MRAVALSPAAMSVPAATAGIVNALTIDVED